MRPAFVIPLMLCSFLTAKAQENGVKASSMFRFIRTEQVTPDANFLIGGFLKVGYVPFTGNLVLNFGTRFTQPFEGSFQGHAFKEYDLDMHPTGRSGALNDEIGDSGGLLIDNAYFDVSQHREGDTAGWRIIKYDAVTWTKTKDIFFPLDMPRENDGDQMVAFINGQIDISSQYTSYGGPPPPDLGGDSHHQFFSLDLEFRNRRILSEVPHINGASMIFVDGFFYFITASAFSGDLIMMKYDADWHYMGMKELIQQAHWSMGVAFNGELFFVSYLDTRQNTPPGFFPYYPNVHLAAFNRDWDLVEDLAVTDYSPQDSLFTGRPSLLLHGNRLYVSYDVVPLPEDLTKIEGFVSMYEIMPVSSNDQDYRLPPDCCLLDQNFPNPVINSTQISFTIAERQQVTLKLYDLSGREIACWLNQVKLQGRHSVKVDLTDLPRGFYFYTMQAGSFIASRKLVVLD